MAIGPLLPILGTLTALVAAGCVAPPVTEPPSPSSVSAPVEVVRDRDGVAHIYAETEADLWFAQGWVTAHDRFFQMDLLRRRAHGRRAEVLGERFLSSDIQSRGLRFTTWAERTDEALRAGDPTTYAVLERYTAGINAYREAALAGEADASLSPQFGAVGYVPEPWTVVDTLAIEKLLTAGLSMRPDQDVILGLLRTLAGADLFADLFRYEPFDPEFIRPAIAAGADRSGPRSGPRELDTLLAPVSGEELARALGSARSLRLDHGGSNNWAVSGDHTASGGALVAGDSHQGITHPATYYFLHLNTAEAGGDFDVYGANFPGVPLVLFGTNGQVAFTPTVSLLDSADAYLETWADPERTSVTFEGAATPVEVREERILVRPPDGSVESASPVFVTMHDVPHHGPVIPSEALDLPVPLTVSVRWTGYQARSVAATFRRFGLARSVDDAVAALDDYFVGGMNWTFGDADGRVAWSARTEIPRREQVSAADPPSGLLPGQGGFEWVQADDGGFERLDIDALLTWVDPPSGLVTTANNDPLGDTADGAPFDAEPYVGSVYDLGTRALRPRVLLEELIDSGEPMRVEDMVPVQLDTESRLAQVLLPYLLDSAARRPDLVSAPMEQALERLAAWDTACPVDSVGATLFHGWLIVASREILEDEGSGLAALGPLLFDDTDPKFGLLLVKFLRHWLDTTAPIIDELDAGAVPFPSQSGIDFFDRRETTAVETRDEVLLAALATTLEELDAIFRAKGSAPLDLDSWTWGAWHRIRLADRAEPWLPEASSADHPKPGGFFTTDVADSDWLRGGVLPDTLEVSNAPSNRFLFDLDPAGVRGLVVLPGGTSERPGDPHHNDQLLDYVEGRYRPLRFLRDDVEDGATWRHTLR